ncbi:MAG: hypothetical protein QXW84_05920 [Archaeoglobaceae archaeon]
MENLNLDDLNPVKRVQPKRTGILAPRFEEVGLRPVELNLGIGEVENIELAVNAKIYPLGVIEVVFTAEFKKASYEDIIRLVKMPESFVRFEGKEVEFEKLPAEIFQKLKNKIRKSIINPYQPFEQLEVYRVVVITEFELKLKLSEILSKFRKQIAGILRGEESWEKLNEKEVEDIMRFYLSYSEDEAIFVNWYSTLFIGGEEYLDELIQAVEIAKIQLLELKTYDNLLDKRIEKAYSSLRTVFVHSSTGIAWLSRTYTELSRTASELAELRIEVVDYVHNLRNILKFTGDWYLGKLYSALSERFRIVEWLSLVDKKLDQLQELYSMAMERVDVYRATTLEFLVLLLIVSLVFLEIIMVVKL